MPGCVAWSSGPTPETAVAGADRVRANLALTTEFHVDVEGVQATEEQRKKASKEIEEVVAEVFAKTGRYEVDQGNATYTLELDVTNSGSPNTALALISGATLGVIPAWATDHYVTDVRLLDATHETVRTTQLVHDQTLLIQILLLPATPFALPSSVAKRAWRNVSEQLVTWTDKTILAHASRPKPPPPTPPAPPAPAPPAPAAPPPEAPAPPAETPPPSAPVVTDPVPLSASPERGDTSPRGTE